MQAINFKISNYKVCLKTSDLYLYNLLKKEFPTINIPYLSSYIEVEFVKQKDRSLSDFLRSFKSNPMKKKITYYYNCKKHSSVFFRNIKFSLSIILQFLLLKKQIIFFHGASAIIDGKGVLFLGPSGSGKTTLISKFPKEFVLSDDVAIVRRINRKFYLLSSPFDFKKYPYVKEKKVALDTIFVLKKAPNNKIRLLTFPKCFNEVFFNTNLMYFIHLINSRLNNIKNLYLLESLLRVKKNNFLTKIMKKFYKLVFNLISDISIKELWLTKEITFYEILKKFYYNKY
jgi:hypothetical protein